MTAKQIYKNVLIELRKMNAPALRNYEFNYYVNKAVGQYVNIEYASYDVSQQTTDNLRVLQGSVYLAPTKILNADSPLALSGGSVTGQSLYGAAYECWLPMDYMHLLNCVCTFEVTASSGCYRQGQYMQKAATRLTSDAWTMVLDDYYNRPSPERPYFQIYNQSRSGKSTLPVDPVTEIQDAPAGAPQTSGTDIGGVYGVKSYDEDTLADGEKAGGNQKRTFTFSNGHKESLVERTAAQRIANASPARLEIRYGRDDSVYVLKEVQVDYLRAPQYIRLTQEQVDLTQDVSQIMEWPDYVCQEITNIVVRLVMERTSDPRLATIMQMNTTIAPQNAAGQQA